MRDSLTVLAGIVIVCLTAALVGPYLIDWNAHRDLIERRLSDAAGGPVTIEGPISVRLLPQPVFKLGRVTVSLPGSGSGRVSADEIDAELSLTSLMRGEVEVVDATLRSPRLAFTAAPGEALPLPSAGEAERVKLQHLAVVDGGFALARRDGPPVVVSGLDFDGEATTLLGPFKATGSVSVSGATYAFRLATGAFDGAKMRLRLLVGGTEGHPGLEIDGDVFSRPDARGPAAADPPPVTSGPSFDGTLTLSGEAPLEGLVATVPWRIGGHVTADASAATLSDLELRAGSDLRALIADGSGVLAFGPTPTATVSLHGVGLDLDRLAVVPEGQSVPAPKASDLLPLVAKLAQAGTIPGASPFPLDLDAGFDTVSVAGETFTGVQAGLRLGGAAPPRVRASASGPDGARAAVDGTVELGAAPVFRGRVEVSVADVPGLAARLRPGWPAFAATMDRYLPVRGFEAAGLVDLSGIGAVARDLSVTLDGSVLSGTMSYTARVGAERARLFADLASDALDLDALPNLTEIAGSTGDLDLSLALDARAARLGASMASAVEAGHLGLRLNKTGADLRLDELTADLDGARLSATGQVHGTTASAEARVTAASLEGLAGLAHRLFPGRATALAEARAAALSPADLRVHLAAAVAPDGSFLPTEAAVSGSANGTDVHASYKPDQPVPLADPAATPASATVAIAGSDAATLLRQLGLAPSRGADLGPGRIEATAHGSVSGGFDATCGLTLGATSLSFKGRARPERGSGHVVARSSDVHPLLLALGMAPAAARTPLPAEGETELGWHDGTLDVRQLAGRWDGIAVTGSLTADVLQPAGGRPSRAAVLGSLQLDRLPASALLGLALGPEPETSAAGRPSERPFEPPSATLPRTEVSLKAGSIPVRAGVEIRNGSLTLRVDRGAVTVADLTGALAEGTVGATLTLRRDGPVAAIAGRVDWNGIAFDTAGISGRLAGTLDLAGSGDSTAALVGAAAGNGAVTVSSGRVLRADPDALARTSKIIDRQTDAANAATIAAVDAEEVKRVLGAELERAPLSLGTVTGPAVLAGGLLRLGPLHAESQQWAADIEGSYDLRDDRTASRTLLRARGALGEGQADTPDAQQVTIAVAGPAGAPARTIDAGGFVNAIEARAIAREQERIDILNQDIRERAYFNRQLKAIEADQQRARERAGTAREPAGIGETAPAGDKSAPAALPAPGAAAESAPNQTGAAKPDAAATPGGRAPAPSRRQKRPTSEGARTGIPVLPAPPPPKPPDERLIGGAAGPNDPAGAGRY